MPYKCHRIRNAIALKSVSRKMNSGWANKGCHSRNVAGGGRILNFPERRAGRISNIPYSSTAVGYDYP